MNIELNDKQFRILLGMCTTANLMLGYLNDHIDDATVTKHNADWEVLLNLLKQKAYEGGFSKLVKEYDGHIITKEAEFEKYMELLKKYDDCSAHNLLANKLAWRDFHKIKPPQEIRALAEEHNGYLGVVLHPFEEKYWNEFEKHEYDRLFVDEKEDQKTL